MYPVKCCRARKLQKHIRPDLNLSFNHIPVSKQPPRFKAVSKVIHQFTARKVAMVTPLLYTSIFQSICRHGSVFNSRYHTKQTIMLLHARYVPTAHVFTASQTTALPLLQPTCYSATRGRPVYHIYPLETGQPSI